MEQRYDIRFNRPEPGSSEISRHRDFDQLMQDFSPPEKAKTARVIPMRQRYLTYAISTAAALALLVIGWKQLNSSVSRIDEATYFANRSFVSPPATANVPDLIAEAVIDPEVEQEIPLDDGELVISHTALFRDRGKSIRRPVQVHYRQMDEVTDYFLAGIPLSYLEGEQNVQLNAAVILDVYATAAGELVDIDAGASVPVHLGANLNAAEIDEEYQLYRLDTLNRRWIAEGTVEATVGEQEWPEEWAVVQEYRQLERDYARLINDLEDAQSTPLPIRPEPPRRQIGDNPTLELDFLNGLALAGGSNVSPEDLDRLNRRGIWEMLPETGDLDLRAFNVVWQEVRLRRLGGDDRYELTLINPEKEERLIIRPILLDDANYRKAMERYQSELAAYEAALEQRQESASEELAAMQRERDEVLEAARFVILDYVAQLPPEERARFEDRRVDFRFSIDSWGLYAVARPLDDLPQVQAVTFTGELKIDQGPQVVYTTHGDQKTIYRGLVTSDEAELPIGENTTVWMISQNGDLSVAERSSDGSALRVRRLGPLPSSASLVQQKLQLD